MKTIGHALFTVSMSALLASCTPDAKTLNTDSVSINFMMTGSGQHVVAQHKLQRTFDFIIPSAQALTPPSLVDANNNAVFLTEAWVVVKKIQFKSSLDGVAGEDAETSVNYRGPYFVDLLSNDPISFGEISLPQKGLRRVKMLLHKAHELPDNVPEELDQKSIFIKGTVGGVPFSYAADETTDLSITGSKAVVPEEGKDLLAVIRVAELFKKIDLTSIVESGPTQIHASQRSGTTNPCPAIHPNSSDLYTCFHQGVSKEAALGNDNGDHELDE